MKNIKLIVLVSCIAGFVSFLVANQIDKSSIPLTTYERVANSGVLRCGYTPYSVGLIKDPATGELSGIYKDILDNLANMLQLKVEWVEEVSWGEQISGLNTRRYDMVCSPANITGPRAKAALISHPFYYSPVYAWSRVNDSRFNRDSEQNLQRANQSDLKIATIDGEQAESQARRFFPKAQMLSAPQSAPFATMYLNVTTQKADIAIAEPTSVNEFMATNGKLLKPINPDKALILTPNILIMPIDSPQFASMINTALVALMADGTVNDIIQKWEKFPNSYTRAPTLH